MALVDIHCHLEMTKDMQGAVKRAEEEGVKAIITSGIDKKTNRNALEIAKKLNVKASLGLYPKDALKNENSEGYEDYDEEEEIIFIRKNKDKISAIGEAGLDFSGSSPDKKSQERLFAKAIALSKELKKPIIVHTRKAEKEALEILEKEKAEKVVLHCFSGGKTLAKEAEKKGYTFSIPANINRSDNFQMIAKEVNINQLLTETDAPFMSPQKGGQSEPKDVRTTVKKIAEIKGLTEEETENNIFLNYMNLFS